MQGQTNLDITAALTFCGIPLAKFEQFVWLLKLKTFHSSTFYRIRKKFIAPVIRNVWEKEHSKVFRYYLINLKLNTEYRFLCVYVAVRNIN